MRVLNFGSTPVRKLLRDTAPTYSAARQGVRGADDGGADCNRYAHALALSVYAVLVAPQHFQRIPELVNTLKTLSRRHEKLAYNAQIFAAISSIIALEISSSSKKTFHDHVKRALGKQPPHAVNHKTARDIVNGYYKNTDSFAALPPAKFSLILNLISMDATTFEITKKLEGHPEDEIRIEIDVAFDVIMSMLPQMLQDEGAASLQSPLQLQSQFQSPPSPVTQVQQPLTSHLLPGGPLTTLRLTLRLQAPEPAPSTPLQQTLPEDVQGESFTLEDFLATIALPCVPAQAQGPTSTSVDPNFLVPHTLCDEDGLSPVSGASVSEQRAAKRNHDELEESDAFARRLDKAGF